jgi:hypothetical protein
MTKTNPNGLRAPLEAGNPRRMTDAKCAWRKMTDAQRYEFMSWLARQPFIDRTRIKVHTEIKDLLGVTQ